MEGIDITPVVQAAIGAAALAITVLAGVAAEIMRRRFGIEANDRDRETLERTLRLYAQAARSGGSEPVAADLAEIVQRQIPDALRRLRADPAAIETKAGAVIAMTAAAKEG